MGSVSQPANALDLIIIGGFDGSQWQPIESELSEFSFNSDKVNTLLSGYIQSKAPLDLLVYKAFTLIMRNIPAIDSEKISQATKLLPMGMVKTILGSYKALNNIPKPIFRFITVGVN